MQYFDVLAPIIKIINLNKDIYEFWLHCEIKNILPGQFINVKIDGFILRRPFSICDYDEKKSILKIVFEIRGSGTKKLSQYKEGQFIDIMLPLGNGFQISSRYKNAAFVGGGIGVPPLLYLSKKFNGECFSILGFRSIDKVILVNDFKNVCEDNVYITTDDGSFGIHGNVTIVLKDLLKHQNIDIVYTCGPLAMMKSVYNCCQEYNIECQVSMEQRMACGIGACLVCACEVKRNSEIKNLHVCKDGPVFNASEVFFND